MLGGTKPVYTHGMNCRTCEAPILAVDAAVDPRALTLALTSRPCGHPTEQPVARMLWHEGMRWTLPVVDAASIITAERHRQVHEEGYTAEHDANLDPADLSWAAWCLIDAALSDGPVTEVPKMWPLDEARWKPDHSPTRRLVIAAALVAAAIDNELLEARRASG